MNNMGQQARADEGIMALKSDAMVDNAHMSGATKVKMADMQAGAIEAQGQAAQQAAMGDAIGQIGGMFGSVVGGIGGGGGVTAPATTSFGGLSKAYNSGLSFGGQTPSQVLQNPNIGYNVFGGR